MAENIAPKHACGICGNTENNTEYRVKEMFIGTREEFTYFQCEKCKCLQITEVPTDMAQYYPPLYRKYYRYKAGQEKRITSIRHRLRNLWFRKKLRSFWKRAYIDRHKSLNRLLIQWLGKPGLPKWMICAGITTDSIILDIGCGDGLLLFQMQEMGFKDLTGIDRFMTFESSQQTGIRFSNQELSKFADMPKKYDLIMLHHALEHLSDQFGTFRLIEKMLCEDGRVVIRIPVVPAKQCRGNKSPYSRGIGAIIKNLHES